MRDDKYILLLLIGKKKRIIWKKWKRKYGRIDINKFEEKNEIIFFDNMKKIKTILSNNKVIKAEIFFTEIYK